MRILAFSRYEQLGASSRLRLYQYLPYLKDAGIDVTVAPFFGDDYIRGLYGNNVSTFAVFKAYIIRLIYMLKVRNFDLVWVEKEMLPWIPDWIELGLFPASVPLVVDYDDAVFHRYDQCQSSLIRWLLGNKIDAIMRRANLVIPGNSYLADHARQAGAKWVEILPTVVDTTRYHLASGPNSKQVTIGWIGSPATAHYLKLIAPALLEVVKIRNVRLVAVGANANQLEGLPIDVVTWTEESEVEQIQYFDIGIMPLPDEPFERGKCGYKLIQCMACGKPVVATPIGANAQIVRDGVEGFWALSQADWVSVLTRLIDDSSLRVRMGEAGRTRVENTYSLNVAAVKLEQLLLSAADH